MSITRSRPLLTIFASVLFAGFVCLAGVSASASAATVATFSPIGEISQVRQIRVTFSESMVPFGDLRQADPMTVACTEPGKGRWVDDKTWVYDFLHDLPPGTRCQATVNANLKSTAGNPVTATAGAPGLQYKFNTGGPAIVRSYPYAGTVIEENQYFALLLNGAAEAKSVAQYAYCEVTGIAERVPVEVITGVDRTAMLKAVNLFSEKDRTVALHCKRALPPDADVTLVWGTGITTPSGVATSHDRRLKYKVRAAFTASFTCERENAQADCLPIRPLRIEFSAPVPQKFAEKIVLTASDGVHKPLFEHNRGNEQETLLSMFSNGYRKSILFFRRNPGNVDADGGAGSVSAVEFAAPLPENSVIKIEIPVGLSDDSGRPLSNAELFPLSSRTAGMPPIVKFAAAPFGILELNAEPMLPVTVRHVEADLSASAKVVTGPSGGTSPGLITELKLTDDKAIIDWVNRLARFHESSVERATVEGDATLIVPPLVPLQKPLPGQRPTTAYGVKEADRDESEFDRKYVATREISLLGRVPDSQRIALPSLTTGDPRPFEVVGIPLPKSGFYVVEIESAKLGAALLPNKNHMFVRTSVLVTNLGVHFKLGASNSMVWVTTLDRAEPVADATVQVSDCNGKVLALGKTDLHGGFLIAHLDPLPLCSDRRAAYFISARKTDAAGKSDLAFTWSDWIEGIEPWRFALSRQGSYGEGREIAHTVLDRTLLRAGQTVSMKHYQRRRELVGLSLPAADDLATQVTIEHLGSGKKYTFPLNWRAGRYAETVWPIPEDAALGEYEITLFGSYLDPISGRRLSWTAETGSFRVEEFRLPVMVGRIVPPRAPLIQPTSIPLAVQISFGNGGPAAGLPVRLSAQLRADSPTPGIAVERYPGFTFVPPAKNADRGNNLFAERYVGEDEDDDGPDATAGTPKATALLADKVPLVLDKNGSATLNLTKLPPSATVRELVVEATYADPNGEVQTLSQNVPVWPSGLVLGMKADDWISVKDHAAAQVLVLDTAGRVQSGQTVSVHAIAHRNQSVRKRLVGGFYSYDEHASTDDLGEVCSGTSDARGLIFCNIALSEPGQIELVATATDKDGHPATSATTVYVTRAGEIWFGAANDDRMDVIPEQRSYEPGQTARFQVRMPFRNATALVAIERDGIIETQTMALSGRDPTIELKVKPEWGPNVFVSVLAVRGRIENVPWYSFFQWGWHSPSEWWKAFHDPGEPYSAPTAMVDLARPAFRLGIAEIQVGIAAHRLKVELTTDKQTYSIRGQSKVHIQVHLPDGSAPPAGSEVAIAAVDTALLELYPNHSWEILTAMIRPRAYDVTTATAQMQIIGKRHFGKKAVAPGGGGGQFPTRELFDTLLLWNGSVALDAHGAADIVVPLNDSLTRFRIVAIADAVTAKSSALFGSASTDITVTQDLQIVSGIPPLVREGDRYDAMVTLRNTTAAPMEVVLTASSNGAVPVTTASPSTPSKAGPNQSKNPPPTFPAQTIHLNAQESREVAFNTAVPFNVTSIDWVISAQAANARDRMKVTQKVVEAVPVRVQQATIMQLNASVTIPIAAPKDALVGGDGRLRGGIDVSLKPRLADGMPGVDLWFSQYPWNCLEQLASRAIGLRDVAAWQSLALRLPLYLDRDGLANYFPPQAGEPTGSVILTAYLLSVTDEAQRLNPAFAIPAETRAKMEDGLIAFVTGKIHRDEWVPAFIRNGGQDERKLTAIEALSRSARATPAMLSSIDLAPNDWPTSSVIDWYLILGRMQKIAHHDERLLEAGQILRARLNVQGTRMGFSTERDDNWWWFMTNGDVNANRLVLAVMNDTAWRDDMPRLVIGTLQRQQEGHWLTTVANLWGSIALETFSKTFEKDPVAGSVRATIDGGAAKELNWAATPAGATLAIPWPAKSSAGGAAGEAALTVTQTGSGKPWLTLTSRAAIRLKEPISTAFRITKTITPTEEKKKGQVSRGDVWRVHLDIDAQADATWVVVNDPIPAGSTLLGSGLGRDSQLATDGEESKGLVWPAYEERSFEAYRAYFRYVVKGKFSLEYTVRINNPGQFGMPSTRVEAMYAPEMFGEWPNPTVTVVNEK